MKPIYSSVFTRSSLRSGHNGEQMNCQDGSFFLPNKITYQELSQGTQHYKDPKLILSRSHTSDIYVVQPKHLWHAELLDQSTYLEIIQRSNAMRGTQVKKPKGIATPTHKQIKSRRCKMLSRFLLKCTLYQHISWGSQIDDDNGNNSSII